ncbi:MAG TPA: LegC family aminotransferase [Spirochaetia bacterium]|nr:LegC family aminotransferase [Spirochaetia bacterium]
MTSATSPVLFQRILEFIKDRFPHEHPVPLHAPRFVTHEKEYLARCIDSTFVSYVGEFVFAFEKAVSEYTHAAHSIAVVNGTAALHMALHAVGVERGDEVLTQALTFVATANAIAYSGAVPVFIDIDRAYLGMSPDDLKAFLEEHARLDDDGYCRNKISGNRIAACVPVHVFGHPCRIAEIKKLCDKWKIALVDDSADSLGSFRNGRHTGTFGDIGVLSFNGNKIVTTGGGGMIITDNEAYANKIKHLTTTAKAPHKWEYYHDEVGYNYRMPNINAAVGCAQMEALPGFLKNKRELAMAYKLFFHELGVGFIDEPPGCTANFWLNAIVLSSREERDGFLGFSNSNGVQTRPVWTLMNKLPMYKTCQATALENSRWCEDRIVNIPSSVRL